MKQYKIALLIGSLRKDSFNKQLADGLVKLPPVELFAHGPADPAVQVPLDLASNMS